MPTCNLCGSTMVHHFADCYICLNDSCMNKQLISDDTRCNTKYGQSGK